MVDNGDTKRTWDTWLDNELATLVQTEEARRFAALVGAVASDVARTASDPHPDAWHSHVLRWMPLINNFMDTKSTNLDLADIKLLAESLWTTVLSTTHDLETQVRSAGALVSVLRLRKDDLQEVLTLPWCPLYRVMRDLYIDALPSLDNPSIVGLGSTRQNQMFNLVAKARRFFGAAAVAEIWGEFSPILMRGCDAGARWEAVLWLCLLLPTHAVDKCEPGQLQGMVAEWMECWDSVACNRTWDMQWASLVSRVTKHDTRGAIDWSSYVSSVFTHTIGVLDLPVGTSDGPLPFGGRPTPRRLISTFMYMLTGQRSAVLAARIIVHMLKYAPGRPAGATAAAAALSAFQHLVCLLEQYYHPSNAGRWSKPLGQLLKYATKSLSKQLAKQGTDPVDPSVAAIDIHTRNATVEALLKLASRAQFSKDEGLSTIACGAMGTLAYICPGAVLPLVVSRFRAALGTSTAMHVLPAAVQSLAFCVRPMLLSGWSGAAESGEEQDGPQLLAQAMMELLPGIDANDEAKTEAVLQLYASVLSCVPHLGEPGGHDDPFASTGGGDGPKPIALPLYADEWSDDLLSRVLGLLDNLDTGAGSSRGTDQGAGAEGVTGAGASAFLIKQGALLGPLFAMLLQKVGRVQGEALTRRLCKWVLGCTLPSVEAEVGTLLGEAACRFPDLVLKELAAPLASAILSELPEQDAAPSAEAGDSAPSMSFTQEAVLTFRTHVLCEVLLQYPGRTLLPLLPTLTQLADRAMDVPLVGVKRAASHLIACLSMVMVRVFCKLNGPDGPPAIGPRGVEVWVSKEGDGFAPPVWEVAPPEQIAAAEQLLATYLLQSATELRELCAPGGGGGDAGGSHASKMRLLSLLLKMQGCIVGFNVCLREFGFGGGGSGGALCIVGRKGTTVGAVGVREEVAGALSLAAVSLAGQHPDVIKILIGISHALLVSGTEDYVASVSMNGCVVRVGNLLSEPPVAATLQGLPTLRRRVPRFIQTMRMQQQQMMRSAHAAFCSWATAERPTLNDVAHLPAATLQLQHELSVLTMHRYRGVRHMAVKAVEAVSKRFVILGRVAVAGALAAIGDVEPMDFAQLLGGPGAAAGDWRTAMAAQEGALFLRLAAAAVGGEGCGADDAVVTDAAPGASGGDEAGADTDRDARCRGAVSLLASSLPLWRIVFRDVDYFAGMLHALLASRAYNTTPVQADLGKLVLDMFGRFLRPPSLGPDSPIQASLSATLLSVASSSGAAAGQRMTWRYVMLANSLSVLLMPHARHASALPHVTHLLGLLSSCEVVELRGLALGAIYFQATCIVEYGVEPHPPVLDALRAWCGVPANCAALMKHLVSNHSVLESRDAVRAGAAARSAYQQMVGQSFEEMLLLRPRTAILMLHTWPSEDAGVALSEGLFVAAHARALSMLARLAPEQLTAGLRPVLEEMTKPERLTQVSATAEKAEQASVAEVVAGLLAAGCAGEPLAGDAGGRGWAVCMLERAMAGTCLEMAEAWAMSARLVLGAALVPCVPRERIGGAAALPASQFGLTAEQAHPVLASLLSLVPRLPGSVVSSPELVNGSASVSAGGVAAVLPARTRLLKYLLQLVRELRITAHRPYGSLPPPVATFWGAVLDEAGALMMGDSLVLREAAGALLAETAAFFPLPRTRKLGAADFEVVEVDGDNSPMEVDVSNGEGAVLLCTRAQLEARASALQARASALQASLVDAFGSAASTVTELRPESDGVGATPAAAIATELPAQALSVLGLGLQLVARGLNAVDPGCLRPWLLALLPHLFRMQELRGPQLQKLALESTMALAQLKHLPLRECDVPAVVDAVCGAVASHVWSARASGLLFTQYFWFRRCFVLQGEQLATLQAAVVGRLEDTKAEVRAAATATLAGMIKGMPDAEADALRAGALARARQLLGAGKRRAGAAGGASAGGDAGDGAALLLPKHGAVLGLKAFLMSAPYDVHAWTPSVLLALVPGAGSRQPAAVRTEASQALAEFKRTHEQDSLAVLRADMSSDDWEAFQAVTSSASYFA